MNAASPPAEQQAITPETGNSVSAQGAAITSESGAVYAELCCDEVSRAVDVVVERCISLTQDATGIKVVYDPIILANALRTELRYFADRTHALRMEQAAPKAAPGVDNSGFDHKTAADFLNGKTISDESVRKFVAASRRAHDEKAALSAMLLSVRGELASREAEIALLKKALLKAEAAPVEQNESAYQRGYMDGMAKGRRDIDAAPQQEAPTMDEIIAAGNGVLLNEQAALLRECRAAIDSLVQQKPTLAGLLCGSTTLGNLKAELGAYRPKGIFGTAQPAPQPAPLSDDVVKDAARYRWLRATTNYVTSNGERIDVRNMPEKWDAAIDAALAARGGK